MFYEAASETNSLFIDISHGGIIITNVIILGFLLKQNGIWNRIKERCNYMWKEYCDNHDIPYTTVDDRRSEQ